MRVHITCLRADQERSKPPNVSARFPASCVNHLPMLNSYQPNQKNKTEMCSTENETHAGKKPRLHPPQAATGDPAHAEWRTMAAVCSGTGVLDGDCLSHGELSGPSACSVDNSTFPPLRAGRQIFNKMTPATTKPSEREVGCMPP